MIKTADDTQASLGYATCGDRRNYSQVDVGPFKLTKYGAASSWGEDVIRVSTIGYKAEFATGNNAESPYASGGWMIGNSSKGGSPHIFNSCSRV